MPIKTALTIFLLLCALLTWSIHHAAAQRAAQYRPSEPPFSARKLSNASFECTNGYRAEPNGAGGTYYIPNDWTLTSISGSPVISSARAFFAGSCDGSAHVERLDGIDSIVIRSQDIETNPEPGKPFDVTFYQQVSATMGTAYSLSGWMLSLCGGSAVPSDCPESVYIAKMLGIDPTGGTDPEAESVVWVENRNNFVDAKNQRVGWQNLFVGAVAKGDFLTIFARINSPFQHHGNHAFVDALSLAQAPAAELVLPPSDPLSGTIVIPEVTAVRGDSVEVRWSGDLGPDIPAIQGGNYGLLFEVGYRGRNTDEWQTLVVDHVGDGCRVLSVPTLDTTYEVRVRALADQIGEGVFPTQRYPSQWSESKQVLFQTVSHEPPVSGSVQIYLPIAVAGGIRDCS